MSLASAKAFLAANAPDIEIIESDEATPTVVLAAQVHGVEPGQIAKTLTLRVQDRIVLVVASGDVRLDNRKMRQFFGCKVRMADAQTVVQATGHPVGGICPFGLATPLTIYCDRSLQAYDIVMPAAGSINSSVRIAPDRLVELVGAEWADLSQTLAAAEPLSADG